MDFKHCHTHSFRRVQLLHRHACATYAFAFRALQCTYGMICTTYDSFYDAIRVGMLEHYARRNIVHVTNRCITRMKDYVCVTMRRKGSRGPKRRGVARHRVSYRSNPYNFILEARICTSRVDHLAVKTFFPALPQLAIPRSS